MPSEQGHRDASPTRSARSSTSQALSFTDKPETYVDFQLLPNFRGPRAEARQAGAGMQEGVGGRRWLGPLCRDALSRGSIDRSALPGRCGRRSNARRGAGAAQGQGRVSPPRPTSTVMWWCSTRELTPELRAEGPGPRGEEPHPAGPQGARPGASTRASRSAGRRRATIAEAIDWARGDWIAPRRCWRPSFDVEALGEGEPTRARRWTRTTLRFWIQSRPSNWLGRCRVSAPCPQIALELGSHCTTSRWRPVDLTGESQPALWSMEAGPTTPPTLRGRPAFAGTDA